MRAGIASIEHGTYLDIEHGTYLDDEGIELMKKHGAYSPLHNIRPTDILSGILVYILWENR